jgi:hypothetical protein
VADAARLAREVGRVSGEVAPLQSLTSLVPRKLVGTSRQRMLEEYSGIPVMKIYMLRQKDYESTFASAGLEGTFVDDGRCNACNRLLRRRVSPIIVEWLRSEKKGPKEIADFSWTGDELIVRPAVRHFLASSFTGFEFGPVQIKEPSSTRAKRSAALPKLLVKPADATELSDVLVTAFCSMNTKKSQVQVFQSCEACGLLTYERRGEGCIVIDEEKWNGADLFKINGFSHVFVCTEKLKREIESRGFSNVTFLELGVIQ